MIKQIQKIIDFVKIRINSLHNIDDEQFYEWHKTFLNWIKNEIQEVEEEIKPENKVYLEDELGDIFWDYMCMIYSMEQEWLINADQIFERAYKKFSERIQENWKWHKWKRGEIKEKQKQELKDEHHRLYWK